MIVGVILTSISVTKNELSSIKIDSGFIIAAVLQILAQLASSFKSIREEQLLHKNDIHPVWLCGVEGIYEFIIVLFMLDPILNFMPKRFGEGLTEDFCAAVNMVTHSNTLIGTFIVYLFIACMFNICVMGVEYSSSAVHFMVSENCVNCISWGIDLLIHYTMGGTIFGLTEGGNGVKWTDLSWLRLFGVVLILFGSLIYVKAITLPFFKYEESSVKVIEMEGFHN